jgi:hypothetical protein
VILNGSTSKKLFAVRCQLMATTPKYNHFTPRQLQKRLAAAACARRPRRAS